MFYNIKQHQQSSPSQYQQSLITTQSKRIINQHNKLINNTPYLTSSFNQQFDIKLKQLVIDYQFDFDKIALHLHYLFPVYEQKITSRTVAVRWWQIMMGERRGKGGLAYGQGEGEGQGKGYDNRQEEGDMQGEKKEGQQQRKRNCNNGYQHKQQFSNSVQQLQQSQITKKQHHHHHITNKTKTTLEQFYTYALQQSLILQQEQSQRPILYKPKFIIDSQYKLQRYEVFDYQGHNSGDNSQSKRWLSKQQNNVAEQNYRQNQNINEVGGNNEDDNQYLNGNNNFYNNNNPNNNTNIHIRQQNIQQILTKVINNQFMYDQFGTFVINQQKQIEQLQKEKSNQQWWERQLSVDSSSQAQQQAQSQPQSLSQQHISDRINNNCQRKQLKQHQQQQFQQNQNHQHHYDHYQQPHNNIQQHPSSQQICKVNNNNKNQLSLQNIHCYQIDDNWAQYESD